MSWPEAAVLITINVCWTTLLIFILLRREPTDDHES